MLSDQPKVSIVSYGVGNLGSVRNMFARLGISTEDVTSPDQLRKASRLLLPGVGAFDRGMSELNRGGWTDAIKDFVRTGKPLLGICLGMQLLLDASEEGNLPGFGFVPGVVKLFEASPERRVPHMGWNLAAPNQAHPLFTGLDSESRFYFVHSYFAEPRYENNTLALTNYGRSFASAVCADNVFGTQFHPEKSHRYGMQLLENFSTI